MRKQEAFLAHGLEVCRVTGTDLRNTPLVVRRLVEARRRALELDRPRRWRLDAPAPSIERELTEAEEKTMYYLRLQAEELPDVRHW